MIELNNFKDVDKLLNDRYKYLTLIYIYDNDIKYKNIDTYLKKENYNNNIKIVMINSKHKNIMDNLDITTYPIIRIYKERNIIDEIFCSYDNIKEILKQWINV